MSGTSVSKEGCEVVEYNERSGRPNTQSLWKPENVK